MKKLIVLFFTISLMGIGSAYAQSVDTANKAEPNMSELGSNNIYTTVDTKPEYTGNLSQDLSKNLKYPTEAKKNDIQGRVIVSFVVEKDGSITNVQYISKKIGYGLEEEAIRVVKSLKKFKPAYSKGKAVRANFKLPITFRLN